MSTILKWAGNKTAIMPELKKHLPAGQRLVEPFAGSCAVMMATDYPSYLIGDVNPDLINMYEVIRDEVEWFIDVAKALFACNNSPEQYYIIREDFNSMQSLDLMWKAAYFLYLNRHCYRGLCRYNRKGHFNTPYGNYKAPYFPETEIRAFAEKAKCATFICAGYDETLTMMRSGDVVYCDPPYDGTFNNYHSAGFTEDDQRKLALALSVKARKGHAVIASNSNTQLIRDLYFSFSNFELYSVTAKRGMGVAAGDGKTAEEVIAVNNPLRWLRFDPAKGSDCTAVYEVRP
ncbi:TPA: DNA adenine methylase [Enterobacter soli]|nr:DNA adenine methylase [Enterobacter asburiae]HEE9788081.1 DNA adenine methylase [Enterobacter soli]